MEIDREFIRTSIVDATSDDYESIDTFAGEIEGWALTEGKNYSYEGLLDILEDLIREGRVGVFVYDKSKKTFVASKFDRAALSEFLFLSKSNSKALR